MKSKSEENVNIIETTYSNVEFCILGKTPLVCNRMSQKAMRQILSPPPRKTTVERSLTLKHNPMEEYRASPYILSDETQPTAIAVMSSAFKCAMKTAALDIPGAKKAQIGRLVFVEGTMTPIYGIPQIYMAIVRSADMNRTPDVRTRAILPEWACRITVTFPQSLMRIQAVVNLLSSAGITAGVGDGRPEKGAMNYGQFRIVEEDDPTFLRVVAAGGRAAQQTALQSPVPHDDETAELLEWFDQDVLDRQQRGTADRKKTVATSASA